MNVIDAKNLFYRYPQAGGDDRPAPKYALRDINLKVDRGEFVAVIGRNGSGKSTLAKQMNALLVPTEGTITIDGLDSSKEENIWRIRQSAGMVFQNPDNQIIATVVEEDVAFGLENLGIEPAEIRRRVDGALSDLGMLDYSTHSPHFLSGGQKQRIAIAGVLAMRPDIIILDEPTAMLDPAGRADVLDAALKLNAEKNITVIYITHFMDEAVLAGRVVVMDEGAIVMDGTPREVFKDAERIRGFGLDAPQILELARLLKDAGLQLPDGILFIDEMVEELCRLKSEI